jgi:hypothetical protein
MRVHVMAAVSQEPCTAAHTFPGEAGLLGHAARCCVAHGMFEIEPVKAGLHESPGCHRVNRPGTYAVSPGRRYGPVGHVGGAVREFQVLQGSATEQDAAFEVDHSPVRTSLRRPTVSPVRDPLAGLGKGVCALHVPTLDGLILIGVHHGLGIAEIPWPKQHASAGRQNGLGPRREGTSRNGWGDKSGHGRDYSSVPALGCHAPAPWRSPPDDRGKFSCLRPAAAEVRLAAIGTLSKGYDLDYIWKQVDQGPAKDAAGYYIQASESGGEPPGRWWGPGAQALGLQLGQVIERKPYDLLFGDHKAPDGTRSASCPAAAARPPTSTRCSWPPSRTRPRNASASSCSRRPVRPG